MTPQKSQESRRRFFSLVLVDRVGRFGKEVAALDRDHSASLSASGAGAAKENSGIGVYPRILHIGAMFETFTYNLPAVLPSAARQHWAFMESNSAAAVMQAVCPREWTDIVDVLSTYRLDPSSWLKPGGNRGDIAEQIDGEFSRRGWCAARLDLETKGILLFNSGQRTELPTIYQEGYIVDNFKNRIVLDVEWNAKDGNLDRDLASYRSWFEAGVISAGVIITKDRLSLLKLARRLWADYQATLSDEQRDPKLPIDLATSTVTAFDKAQMRVRRGVMGSCPILIVAATETTWNGQPYS